MPGNPFSRSPDAFLLCFDAMPNKIYIAAFESQWGTTDEHLVYYKGTLMGQLVQGSPAAVALVPNLDRLRAYPWPTAEEFWAALWRLLADLPGWHIHCERDCDQEPINEIRDMASLHNQLVATLQVCATGGGLIPTFSASAQVCRP